MEIKLTLDNDKITKSIVINNSRKIYTSKEKDITIIEIDHEKDNINFDAFLNVDENIYKDDLNEKYQNESVYIIHYENGKKAKYSLGIIRNISDDKININHNCATEEGSSGSPIINLQNYGVIGIHRGFFNKINKGILLKIPIEEFNIYNN
jgi:V8-like Glu-specific endopeptidase